jgi:hypothetical protein
MESVVGEFMTDTPGVRHNHGWDKALEKFPPDER